MNEITSTPWQLYHDQAVDYAALTAGEILAQRPCARHIETGQQLTVAELVSHLNVLERQVTAVHPADDDHRQRIRQALYAAGIDWNATTAQLAGCDWVTEAYIRQHTQLVAPNFLGLAIQRMLDGLPPPLPARERRQQAILARYPHIRR